METSYISLCFYLPLSHPLSKHYVAPFCLITTHKRGRATHSTVAIRDPNSSVETILQMWRNCSETGQCPMLIKNPPAEDNGVIDHLVSSLKPCVSSHSFNNGKMSTIYRPGKMDRLILCYWLWDMFMKSYTSTHRSLCQSAQSSSFCPSVYINIIVCRSIST